MPDRPQQRKDECARDRPKPTLQRNERETAPSGQ
jgi:hypothetical protein